MAWTWPEIELTGDAYQHYFRSGTIAAFSRDTHRLLAIYLLSAENGAAAFKSMVSIDNRFLRLTGELRTAADLLSTILREGMLTWSDAANAFEVRDGTEVLFAEYTGARGKSSHATSDGAHQAGDSVSFRLFELKADAAGATVEAAGEEVELDAGEYFLYMLNESTINAAVHKLELVIPQKTKVYAGSKAARGSGLGGKGVSRLSKHGRAAVVALKQMLPVLTTAQLAKMVKTADPTSTPPADKEDLMKKVITLALPNYSYENPMGTEEEVAVEAVAVETAEVGEEG